MPMALGMKDISNLGYMHCTTAVSLEMSDEPSLFAYYMAHCIRSTQEQVRTLF